MSNDQPSRSESRQRESALSRWDDEGGAGLRGPEQGLHPTEVPELTNVELVQLRVRVIALENLLIGLLAEAPERQLEVIRDMATYISPRPGFTQHPLTVQAAASMIHLVDRAGRFRIKAPS
jgi:hypothetical protein